MKLSSTIVGSGDPDAPQYNRVWATPTLQLLTANYIKKNHPDGWFLYVGVDLFSREAALRQNIIRD